MSREKCIENLIITRQVFAHSKAPKFIHVLMLRCVNFSPSGRRVRAESDCDDECYLGDVMTLSPVSVSGQGLCVRSPAITLITPGLGYRRWTANLDSQSSFNGMGRSSDTSPHLLQRARDTCSALWESRPHHRQADT